MSKISRWTCFLLFFSIYFFISCKSKDEISIAISNFDPIKGDYNSIVTINGSNFSSVSGGNHVYFGNLEANIISETATQIKVTVPPTATSGRIKIKANGKETLTTTEYEVTCGRWASNGKLQYAVTRPAYFAINNKIYIHTPSTLWMFDPVTQSTVYRKELSTKFSPSLECLQWASSDKGYILDYPNLNEYDPATNTWTKKASCPNVNPGNKYAAMGVMYFEETKLAFVFFFDKTIGIYSATDDQWRRSIPAVLPPDDIIGFRNIYLSVIGTQGYIYNDYTKRFWKFDPATTSFTPLKEYPGFSCQFIFSLNGEIYIGNLAERDPIGELWRYNTSKNEWIQKAYPIADRQSPMFLVANNIGYIFGGLENYQSSHTNTFSQDIFSYTP